MDESYRDKFERIAPGTLFPSLETGLQARIKKLATAGRLTYQELRQLSVAGRDLSMWSGLPPEDWWSALPDGREGFRRFLQRYEDIRTGTRQFPEEGFSRTGARHMEVVREESGHSIFGMCPVASTQTLCCRLRTIDAVRGCPFGCSYCSIQTFYGNRAVFDAQFGKKLKKIQVEPGRFHRFGSGQSSDSLVWGNRYGVLDDLLQFARDHQEILLELKTKSDRTQDLIDREIPRNAVCTWSLNPPRVIRSEEHGTPGLADRISAARIVADRGVKVGFHFHPIMHYEGWEKEYTLLASKILGSFLSREVLFLSFGTVTLIKPVIRAIRERGGRSRILQMPTALDPKGKITYPDSCKVELLSRMVKAFDSWGDEVYRYLCMEKPDIWLQVMGFTYGSNDEFEQDFGKKTMSRLSR